MMAIIPLYSLSVLAAFFSARSITVYVNGHPAACTTTTSTRS